MEASVLATAVCAFVIGVGVLWFNPHRLATQALAALSILCAIWCSCVYVGLRLQDAGLDAVAEKWFIADNIVAAFFAWSNWVLKEALIRPENNWRTTLRRSMPWLVIGAVMVALALSPSFILPAPVPGGPLERGGYYFAYVAIELVAHGIILAQAVRQMRLATGIRRIETQYLILNISMTCFVGAALNGIGSVIQVDALKQLGFPITLLMLALMGWAMTVHRIFGMRQVLLSIAQRTAIVAVISLGLLAITQLVAHTLGLTTKLLITGLAVSGAIWFDRKSRAWLELDGRQVLERLRRTAIDISLTRAGTDDLVSAFEALLRKECHADFAAIIANPAEGSPRLPLFGAHPAYATLCELGWATPESLQRRRPTPGITLLREFMHDHELGLVLTAPRGSPNPSLALAVGTKISRGPFTFPEVERLISLAEFIDNIVARSRLTTQAALQAKTEHLAMMSRGLAHDLKNLITPISSFLVHTERGLPPDSVEAEVHGAAQRSVRIITDYVGEALFFADRLKPRLERVSVPALLGAVRDLTAGRAGSRSITLRCESDPEVLLVADAVLLQRMLANLVANAIDASAPGAGVTISIRRAGATLVRLTVADQGCGIPDANLKRVFDPYFTTKEFGEDVRGFGLGLTICQKIVALHDGTISLRSEVGLGTTVTVDLPRIPPGWTPPAPAKPPALAATRTAQAAS